MTTVYAWKGGSQHKISAQVAGEELSRVRKSKGQFFTPADVVEVSKPSSAPLHPEFEWNDRKAAIEFRKEQARYLINSVVVFEEEAIDEEPVRAFVSVRTEDGPRFTDTAYAFSVPDMREQIISQALTDMRAFERKYGQFIELAKTIDAFKIAATKAQKTLPTPKPARDVGPKPVWAGLVRAKPSATTNIVQQP